MHDHLRLKLSAACLAALLYVSCSKSGGGIDGQDENSDDTPPAVVTDLDITEITPTSVSLRWSATGDDGDSGTAATYDLRFFEHKITSDNWDSATQVDGLPSPSGSGELDSVTIDSLLEDSTYYFALRLADSDNNWSGLSNVAMAICFDDFPVTLPDTAFARLMRFYIPKPSGDILRSDLLYFERLNAANQHIRDLSGIEYCINLQRLDLWNNRVLDLGPLAGLAKLRVLRLGANGLTDIGPLQSLTGLDTLHLNANAITDITALANMSNLTELTLTANTISNTGPLEGKTTIRSLALDQNQIVFTNPLYNLTGLERLNLSGNLIDDLLPLAHNTGLGAGDSLWLTGNPLSASTTDSLFAVLQSRGVTVIQ